MLPSAIILKHETSCTAALMLTGESCFSFLLAWLYSGVPKSHVCTYFVIFFVQTGTDRPREPWLVVDAGLQAQQAGWLRDFEGNDFPLRVFLFRMAVQETSDSQLAGHVYSTCYVRTGFKGRACTVRAIHGQYVVS